MDDLAEEKEMLDADQRARVPEEITASERAELEWLRRHNKLLTVEREMLLKIAASYQLDIQLDR